MLVQPNEYANKINQCVDLLGIHNLSARKNSPTLETSTLETPTLETLCEKLADRLSLIHNTPKPRVEFLKNPPYKLFSKEYDVVEHTIVIQKGIGIDASIATIFKAFSHIRTYMQAISSALRDDQIAAEFLKHEITFHQDLIEAAKERNKKHPAIQKDKEERENRIAAAALIQGALASKTAATTSDPDEYQMIRRLLASNFKPELDANLAELEAKRFMLQLRLKHLESCSGQRFASNTHKIKIVEQLKSWFNDRQLTAKLAKIEQLEVAERGRLNNLIIKYLGICPAFGLPDLTPLIDLGQPHR